MTTLDLEVQSLAAYPGLSRRTAEILSLISRLWPCDDGPAHVVIADFNLETVHIQTCVRFCDDPEHQGWTQFEVGHPIFAATKTLLECLLEIPEAERLPSFE